MNANAELEIFPRPVRRINGGAQGNSYSEACPVSQRQAERAGLDDKVSSGLSVLSREGDRFVNSSVGGGPSIVRTKASLNQFPMHFGQVHRAGRSRVHEL